MNSLPPDVVMRVVAFLPDRKDREALAACNTYLAGRAHARWPDWFGIQPCMQLDVSETKRGSLLAAVKDRALPGTTRLELKFIDDAIVGGDADADSEIAKGPSIQPQDQLELVRTLVARAPNLQDIKLFGTGIPANALVEALKPLEHLRRLRVHIDAPAPPDGTTWRFDVLDGLDDLGVFVLHHDEHFGQQVAVTVPSSLAALSLYNFRDAMPWQINEILPTGLRKLRCVGMALDDIDYSRLPDLDTLICCGSGINLHDLPDSLTTLRIVFQEDSRDGHWIMDAAPDDAPHEACLCISHLTRLRDLEIANFQHYELTYEDCVQTHSLTKLTGLTRLSLKNVGMIDTQFLAGSFPHLVDLSLDVYPGYDIELIPPLPDAPLLSTLQFSLASVSVEFSKDCDYCTVPLRLGPSLPAPEPTPEPALDLSCYARLHTLLLHCAELDTAAAEHLLSLPALCTLTLRTCKMSPRARNLLSDARFEVLYEEEFEGRSLLWPLHIDWESLFYVW